MTKILSLLSVALALAASSQAAAVDGEILVRTRAVTNACVHVLIPDLQKRQSSGSIRICSAPNLSGTCDTLYVTYPGCQSLPVLAPAWDNLVISAVPLSSKSLACTAYENSSCTGASVTFTFGGPQNVGQIVPGISAFACSLIPPPF
ncbi:hypothetical protein DXG03_001154 [Asterophora parasitica]|uniref:Uncharacterized protein n=1 Tax=Asterophora parasitica TaxID=117018 RepID=A0A9P7GD68_9AGAR|nr:hypothetical protein DXG03_001154 [Asterophora parasitica]